MPLPRRRALDAFPVELKGEHYFVLRDTEGLLDDPMILDEITADLKALGYPRAPTGTHSDNLTNSNP